VQKRIGPRSRCWPLLDIQHDAGFLERSFPQGRRRLCLAQRGSRGGRPHDQGRELRKKRKIFIAKLPPFSYITPEISCSDRGTMKDKTEVIKHSAAIQIQNSISLLQRRAWNILLANAYEELPTAEEHHISVTELTGVLGYTSRNDAHLREALIGLMTTVLEWNLIGKDNAQVWGATTLLAQIEIEDRTCTYSYSPVLRRRLYNPKIYARISLSLQNKFDSKHALALWELCLDYLDESRNYGETPYIPLEQYRKLMGMSEDMYPLFKDLNKYVIKASIKEINDVTDFNITGEYARNSRKVVAIKFRVRRVLQLPQASTVQPVLFPSGDLPDIVKELMEIGLSEQDAGEIWQQQFAYVHADRRPRDVAFDYYIREKIHLLRKQDPRKVKSKTGFLLQAIKQNWTNHEYAASQKEKLKQDKTARLNALQDQKHQLGEELEEQTSALCKRIVADKPDLLDHLLQAVLKEAPVTRALYDEVKTPVQHYQNSPIFASLVDKKLMMEYPQHFETLRTTYREKIARIEHEIAAVRLDV
jgi:plasmid replication initiation protein